MHKGIFFTHLSEYSSSARLEESMGSIDESNFINYFGQSGDSAD